MTSTFASRGALGRLALTSLGIALLAGCRTVKEAPKLVQEKPMTPTTEDKPDAATPCEVVFGAACGVECAGDQDCESGLHCENAACAADCIEDSDCHQGSCSPAGRCVKADDIRVDPVETDPTDPTMAPVCVEGQVEFKAVAPQVWLLLDRSGSMADTLSGSTTRWNALGNVLFGDPAVAMDRGVVGDFDSQVAFGAVFYTSGSASTGCVLDLSSVALANNNYKHIRERYNKLAPSGGTPTPESIAATVAVAASSDLTGGPKLLVLATDGAPGTCKPGSGVATTEVENQVSLAFQKQIKTFAIAISTGTDIAHMQRVANLGVGLAANATPPAPLYTATSQNDLKSAFSTILTTVPRSCVFSLNGTVDEDNADQGTVVLDDQTLVYNDPDGWRLKQADQVELVGSACKQIQDGEDNLKINFPCAVFTPVIK
ncbi:MAG TPA: hypothetical protein VFK05_24520 [Polyangiaceae bacterium]|nr:hypothetical protein [Polyangiaceae bacterium]